jgi:hypothetical protein
LGVHFLTSATINYVATLKGIVFRCPANANGLTTIDAEYVEEMPLEHFNQRYKALPRLYWSFGYRKQRHSLWESKRYGTYFQVQFWYHAGDCAAADQTVVETRTKQHVPGATANTPTNRPAMKELVQIHEDVHGALPSLAAKPP